MGFAEAEDVIVQNQYALLEANNQTGTSSDPNRAAGIAEMEEKLADMQATGSKAVKLILS